MMEGHAPRSLQIIQPRFGEYNFHLWDTRGHSTGFYFVGIIKVKYYDINFKDTKDEAKILMPVDPGHCSDETKQDIMAIVKMDMQLVNFLQKKVLPSCFPEEGGVKRIPGNQLCMAGCNPKMN